MAEPVLDQPRVVTGIGQGVAAGVAQHVSMDAFFGKSYRMQVPGESTCRNRRGRAKGSMSNVRKSGHRLRGREVRFVP
jgi:hypothetical protein